MVNSLREIYHHNKDNAPQAYIDFVQCFTPNGLSKEYFTRYGSGVFWHIYIYEQNAVS